MKNRAVWRQGALISHPSGGFLRYILGQVVVFLVFGRQSIEILQQSAGSYCDVSPPRKP